MSRCLREKLSRSRRHAGQLSVVPGPAALIAALTASGLPCHNFVFEGFLPVKPTARRKKLEQLKSEERTMIFYESPYRLLKTLRDMEEVLGDPWVVCVRELTKRFEEVREGRPRDLLRYFSKTPPRGEFVLLLKQ